MAANFLNTNRNATRYFFATTENGEQDLGLSFGTTGGLPNLSTMSVTLSGGGGSVIVNQAPQFVASEFVIGEKALITGTDSTYFTASTLTSSIVGVNISYDREGGSGTACLEAYSGNGSTQGFEFLTRGINSALVSTVNSTYNNYVSSIGRPGATVVMGGNGTTTSAKLVTQGIVTALDLSASVTTIPIFPTNQTNIEFQAGASNVVAIAGASNQALPYMPLFSTPLSNLNPNGKTFLYANWANSLSTGSNLVNFKVGFSTATAYTNTLQTSAVPGGSWTPGGQPSGSTPIGHTVVSAAIDPDGVNPDGTGTLYVLGQLADPLATADQLYLDKGAVTEPTRYAIAWHAM